MTIKLCGAFIYRNSSILSSPSNHSNISDVEWITTSISLIIFILAFIGNTAALIVMFGSRGPIRLTNNRYLANLACADLLRACFMPFTIIARMKRNFMFGKMICKILPIVQGLSVAVDVFTLVCISIERYLAICRPLLILSLQSVRFANLLTCVILLLIWSLGLLIALPNLYMYNLCSLPKPGRFKCEKTSPQEFNEKLYMIALDAFYFVIPMVVMIVLYTLIIWKMYRNSTAMQMRSFRRNSNASKIRSNPPSPPLASFNRRSQYRSGNSDLMERQRRRSSIFEKIGRQLSFRISTKSRAAGSEEEHGRNPDLDISLTKQQFKQKSPTSQPMTEFLYQNNHDQNNNNNNNNNNYNHITKILFQQFNSRKTSRSRRFSSSHGLSRTDRHRRKALKLLIVLIMEFFVCWTPLFIYHTIGTFNKNFYRSTPNICVDLILLFSFASASCNPLTYYFMSKRYRSALYDYLRCCFVKRNQHMFINQKQQHLNHISKVLYSNQKENSNEQKCKEHLEVDTPQNARLRSKTC